MEKQYDESILRKYILSSVADKETQHESDSIMNVKEYLGPVEIRTIDGKGRGLISKSNIESGELIVVAKPLSIVLPQNSNQHQCHNNNESKLLSHVQKLKTLRESLQTLVETEPETRKKILHLHAGPQLGFLEMQEESPSNQTFNIAELRERIERICALNSFEGISSLKNISFGIQAFNSSSSCYGLWYYPSFLNHSCIGANCHWTIYGSLMIVRATKTISKGQELLISYIDPNQPYKKRLSSFLKHHFQCDCCLCELERNEGPEIRKKREILTSNFNYEVLESEVNYNNIHLIQNYIEEINSLKLSSQTNNEIYNVFLIKPLIQLSLAYYEARNFEKASEAFKKVFDYCTHLSQFTLLRVSCILTIIVCITRQEIIDHCNYKRNDLMDKVQMWKGTLQECLIIQYGKNVLKHQDFVINILTLMRASFVEEMNEVEILDWLCSFE